MRAKRKRVAVGIIFALLVIGVLFSFNYLSLYGSKTSDIYIIKKITKDGFVVEGFNPIDGKFERYVSCPSTTKHTDKNCWRTVIYDSDGNYVGEDQLPKNCFVGEFFNSPQKFEKEYMRYLIVIDQGRSEPVINLGLTAQYSEWDTGSGISWYLHHHSEDEEYKCNSVLGWGKAIDSRYSGVKNVMASDKEKYLIQLTHDGKVYIQFLEPYASRPYCGNGICDDNEDWENCPEDCATEEIQRLESDLQRKINVIKQMNATIAQKAEYIKQLTDKADEQAQIINELNLELEEKAKVIADLKLTAEEEQKLIDLLSGENEALKQELADLVAKNKEDREEDHPHLMHFFGPLIVFAIIVLFFYTFSKILKKKKKLKKR